jgi:hypothetical protein
MQCTGDRGYLLLYFFQFISFCYYCIIEMLLMTNVAYITALGGYIIIGLCYCVLRTSLSRSSRWTKLTNCPVMMSVVTLHWANCYITLCRQYTWTWICLHLIFLLLLLTYLVWFSRSQWPHGLRRRSAAARLLRLWIRIPPRSWMPVGFDCCFLSSIGICDELITRPEEFYWFWCVVVCGIETWFVRRLWLTGGSCPQNKTNMIWVIIYELKYNLFTIS